MNAGFPPGTAPPSTREPQERLDPWVRAAAAFFVGAQKAAVLRLYRMHLQSSVKVMNRLAFEIAAASGNGPADVAKLLRPPTDWPWRLFGGARRRRIGASRRTC